MDCPNNWYYRKLSWPRCTTARRPESPGVCCKQCGEFQCKNGVCRRIFSKASGSVLAGELTPSVLHDTTKSWVLQRSEFGNVELVTRGMALTKSFPLFTPVRAPDCQRSRWKSVIQLSVVDYRLRARACRTLVSQTASQGRIGPVVSIQHIWPALLHGDGWWGQQNEWNHSQRRCSFRAPTRNNMSSKRKHDTAGNNSQVVTIITCGRHLLTIFFL